MDANVVRSRRFFHPREGGGADRRPTPR